MHSQKYWRGRFERHKMPAVAAGGWRNIQEVHYYSGNFRSIQIFCNEYALIRQLEKY